MVLSTTMKAREIKNFDSEWKFVLQDTAEAKEPTFNDASWRKLNLPHDWAFESEYSAEGAQKELGGYKSGGIGWYRKSFDMLEAWKGKSISIEFDAVYMNSEVFINGHNLGKRPYGYICLNYDLTKYMKPGKNSIAVKVDSRLEPSARWYHGCGIYGHVKLVISDPVHIAKDGLYITTPKVTKARADVSIKTEIVNTTPQVVSATLETVILDPSGKEVAKGLKKCQIELGKTAHVKQDLNVATPKCWDTSTPNLYKVVSSVLVGDKIVDKTKTTFGIRTIRWDTKTGFWLNDRVVKLRGVSEHLEGGPVGAAYPDELIRWKIQLLKDMGCNAIRTAHNPQVPKFYDLCNEMGILVMDEIFDGWKQKAPEDYGKQAFEKWWERDLRAWLKRDRNHPSVIIWSLGNETRGSVAEKLVEVCHEVDPTRLATSGHSGTEFMDVDGVNGLSETIDFFEEVKKNPLHKPFVATEAPHTWQTRGFYRSKTWYRDGYPNINNTLFPCPDLTETEIFTYDWTNPENKKNRKQVFNPSYDTGMVRITARKNWELMRDLPWYCGHFRWTGFDYLGEAGYVHGGWPFRLFMGGALDLAGFKKDLYYFYQSQWTKEPMIHILPHWTHPKMKAGTKIPVWVYSNCDEVELFLNGKSLGKDIPGTKWDEMQCDWMVPWTPGTIEAVGYKKGKETVRTAHTTAGVPAQLKLAIEGGKYPIITVTETDNKGIMNPYAENRIHYFIDGPARILSLESGNPVNTENNYGKSSRTAFFGLARAFLKTTSETSDISIVVGAICGEKQIMTSDMISIDVRGVAVRGELKNYNLKIKYSIDGSIPSIDYTEPFAVKQKEVIKADVYSDSQLLFSMEEKFGSKEGIYWGDLAQIEAQSKVDKGGDQAEDAEFKGAKISQQRRGFHGKGYLDFGRNQGAYVEWYEENDGSAGQAKLSIRYSGKAKNAKGRKMKLTVNDKDKEIFFPNTKNCGTEWQTLKVKVKREEGTNTIRLTTIEKGGMEIDDITVI